MAKIFGLNGVLTGKQGGTVFVVRNGENIARKYQPVVSNPSTQGQIEARAKLKLLSQLSAVMAPVIAIPRVGAVSSRNLFTKKNYAASSYANQQAQINLTAIQLTKSVVALPTVTGTFSAGTANVQLAAGATGLSRVVYAAFAKQADDKLRLAATTVISAAGNDSTFPATLTVGGDPVVVYAYGVRDNTEAARVKFGELTVVSAETVAKIVTDKTLTEADITLTETQAVELS